MNFAIYTIKTEREIIDEFNSSIEFGLNSEEVARRCEKYGRNETRSSVVQWHDVLFRQFRSPFIYLLIAASLLSFVFGELIEGLMILVFVAINAAIGFYQEYRSERASELLKQFISSRAKVIRNGDDIVIDSRDPFLDVAFLFL